MKKESEVFLMKEYKKILIPTDGSPGAEEAVKKGLSLAKLIGAEVLALYVKDYRILAGLPETEEVIFIGNGLEEEGKGAIEFVKKEAKNLGVKCEGKIVEGHPQAKIVEVDVRAARELGIKWRAGNLGFPTVATHAGGNVTVPVGAPSATFVFSTLKSLASIDATLSMLEERRKARILSEPRVAVADNEEAMILSGKKVPVITLDFAGNKIIRFYDVALKLTVTPHINPERQIMMELHPEVSDLSSEATVQGGVIILANEVRTKLMVKEGETAVIGGILRTKESTIRKGVPILSHIPLLGNLFKYTSRSRNKTELIIFITPTIVPVEKQ